MNPQISKNLLLTFDVDGVLLDYTGAFADIMRRVGLAPNAKPGIHYHCKNKFGFDPHELPAPERAHFYEIFDRHGWNEMPAIPGAVEALARLVDAGHRIRYLTSMPMHKSEDRLSNLKAHGFPDAELVATGHRLGVGHHPKAPYLDAWNPDWFVDDWAYNFKGISPYTSTRFALILDGSGDHPNLNEESGDRPLAHKEFSSANFFADFILSAP